MQSQRSGLLALPVELLYEVQLYALSPSLPYLSHAFLDIFKESPVSFRVQYLLASCISNSTPTHTADILTKALRYPLCTPLVLDQLCSRINLLSELNSALIIPDDLTSQSRKRTCQLPRRLFRSLAPRKDGQEWGVRDEPLPFLQPILHKGTSFPPFDPNSHQGYALTRAVHARHTPLIRLLLDLGASPSCKEGMAVKVAIKQKNLKIVKMLVERDDRDGSLVPIPTKQIQKPRRGKRRRLEDRVEVHPSMLKLAVKCNARDIVDYFAWEKGTIPDMQTLTSLRL